MNRERIEMAKQVFRLNAQRLREQQGYSTDFSEAEQQHIIDDIYGTVAGLTREEFGAAMSEMNAEIQRSNALMATLTAMGNRLGGDPDLTMGELVRLWADAGDPEAIALLESGALKTVRVYD